MTLQASLSIGLFFISVVLSIFLAASLSLLDRIDLVSPPIDFLGFSNKELLWFLEIDLYEYPVLLAGALFASASKVFFEQFFVRVGLVLVCTCVFFSLSNIFAGYGFFLRHCLSWREIQEYYSEGFWGDSKKQYLKLFFLFLCLFERIL